MSSNPLSSNPNDDDSALSDDELDGVVGGDGGLVRRTCAHGWTTAHEYVDPGSTTKKQCGGPLTFEP